MSPRTPRRRASAVVIRSTSSQLVLGQGGRRDETGRVARVHARLLDVLHHRADEHVRAVGDRVDVDLDRPLEEPIDQDRMIRTRRGRRHHEPLELRLLVHDLHRPAAQDVRRPNDDREPDLARDGAGLDRVASLAVRRRRDLELPQDLGELRPVLGEVDRGRGCAEDPETGALEVVREPQRRLPAELTDDADRLLRLADREHVLRRHRLEVQPGARVVVRRDGLGVRVHHHGLVPRLAQREGRVDARVVELDPLADAVRPGADDHDPRALGRTHLVLLLVRRVVVRACARGTPRRTCRRS